MKCKKCGSLYFKSQSSEQLQKEMKKRTSKFKFYDIVSTTSFHGVGHLDTCLDCGNSEFVVQYLGAPEEFVNDNWLDIIAFVIHSFRQGRWRRSCRRSVIDCFGTLPLVCRDGRVRDEEPHGRDGIRQAA